MSDSLAINKVSNQVKSEAKTINRINKVKLSISESVKKKLIVTAFILPALIPITLFVFFPLLKSFILSVHMTNARGEMVKYVGAYNFKELLSSKLFLESTLITAKFTLFTTVISIAVSLFLAIIANEKIKGMGFFRTIFSSTIGISVSAASTIWLFMYHPSIGIINSLLNKVGINGVNWLTDSNYSLPAVIITTIWMEVGFGFLILTAGLNNISEEIYESADIDGAGYFCKLFNITLPLLTPSLYYLLTVTTIKSLQSFGQVHVLTGGGPATSTTTLVYRLWTTGFIDYRFGLASVIGLVLSLMILLITLVQFKLEKKVHYQ